MNDRLPLIDRDLDPSIGHDIAIMLDTYTTWLNRWLDADPHPISDHRYNPRQFLDRHMDTPPYLYGSSNIDAMYDSDYHHVVALTIHDGDDGGSTSLTGWFTEYPVWGTGDNNHYTVTGLEVTLVHMTQEFDTMVQFILNEGKFVTTPDTPEESLPSVPATTTPQEGN